MNGSKSWLIIKSDVLEDEAKKVFGDEVNITAEGQHHFEAVTGSQEFKDQYCREKVLWWKGQLEALSEIARSQPHTAYTVFTKGYKSKFIYFMTLSKKAIDYLLLPTLFGQTEPLPSDLRQLVTSTPAQVPWAGDWRFEAPQQFAASTSLPWIRHCIPHLLVRLAHNYNLSIMGDSTSEAR